jgi:hypothetical protein
MEEEMFYQIKNSYNFKNKTSLLMELSSVSLTLKIPMQPYNPFLKK